LEDKEKHRIRNKEWYKKTRSNSEAWNKRKKQQRIRYARMKSNPSFKRRKRIWNAKSYAKRKAIVKLEVLTHYSKERSPVCKCCGEKNIEFLGIDHVKGKGSKHRKELGLTGGINFYRWLKRKHYPEGYRVLCYNCNLSRGFFGYCPHKRSG